jgi:TPR repeat protein
VLSIAKAEDAYQVGDAARRNQLTEIAIAAYQPAADQGNIRAMLDMGYLLDGRDALKAEMWWRRAANGGDTNAMYGLGVELKRRETSTKPNCGCSGRSRTSGNSKRWRNLDICTEIETNRPKQ